MRTQTLRATRALSHFPRTFSTTTAARSVLFNLNGLAHSRESQYLSKERGLPRTEYSSNIHLIRSSEVDVLGPSVPGSSIKQQLPQQQQPPQPSSTEQQHQPPPPQTPTAAAAAAVAAYHLARLNKDFDLALVPPPAAVAAAAAANAHLIAYVLDAASQHPPAARRTALELLVAQLVKERCENARLRSDDKEELLRLYGQGQTSVFLFGSFWGFIVILLFGFLQYITAALFPAPALKAGLGGGLAALEEEQLAGAAVAVAAESEAEPEAARAAADSDEPNVQTSESHKTPGSSRDGKGGGFGSFLWASPSSGAGR